MKTVGLYNTGYILTMTYAGLVFSAMETDFFPRLSAVNSQWQNCNDIINKQIEVSLLLISPMLVAAQFAVPFVIPILFTTKFMPVVDMVRILLLAIYLRAIKLPISYLPLAKGDSLSYLFLEAVYDILVVLLVIWGYSHWQLLGTGVAITISAVFDNFMIMGYSYLKFHYRPTASVLGYSLLHLSLGVVAFLLATFTDGWQWWIGGLLVFIMTTVATLYTFYHKVALWNKLMSNLKRRFSRHA